MGTSRPRELTDIRENIIFIYFVAGNNNPKHILIFARKPNRIISHCLKLIINQGNTQIFTIYTKLIMLPMASKAFCSSKNNSLWCDLIWWSTVQGFLCSASWSNLTCATGKSLNWALFLHHLTFWTFKQCLVSAIVLLNVFKVLIYILIILIFDYGQKLYSIQTVQIFFCSRLWKKNFLPCTTVQDIDKYLQILSRRMSFSQ